MLIAITQFNQIDSDRDNILEKQKVGELSSAKEFFDNNTSRDGALSLEEVIEEKLADFGVADTNKEGMLTIDEVNKFYEDRQ